MITNIYRVKDYLTPCRLAIRGRYAVYSSAMHILGFTGVMGGALFFVDSSGQTNGQVCMSTLYGPLASRHVPGCLSQAISNLQGLKLTMTRTDKNSVAAQVSFLASARVGSLHVGVYGTPLTTLEDHICISCLLLISAGLAIDMDPPGSSC